MTAYSLGDAAAQRLHLFGREGVLGREAHVPLVGYGDEMDMCMRHFKTYHGDSYALAVDSFLHALGNTLGKKLKGEIFLVAEIEDVAHLALGNNQNMPRIDRIDVEKGEMTVVLGYLVARYLACYNA